MKNWPPQHRNLAALTVFLLIACVAVFFLVLRPKAQNVALAREAVDEKEQGLKETGWPLDAERLERLLVERGKKLDGPKGIKKKADEILRDATDMFALQIEQNFGSTSLFVSEISELDYRQEFNQLETDLREAEIVLAEEILGLGVTTSSPHIYQLVLQVWTLRELAELAVKNNLNPVKDLRVTVRVGENESKKASKLTVLPVRAYYVDSGGGEPYLLEIPVRMTLRGELTDFCNFLRGLHADGKFLPVSSIELRTERPVLPSRRRGGRARTIKADSVVVELECCAFFRLREEAPKHRRTQRRQLPRGA